MDLADLTARLRALSPAQRATVMDVFEEYDEATVDDALTWVEDAFAYIAEFDAAGVAVVNSLAEVVSSVTRTAGGTAPTGPQSGR